MSYGIIRRKIKTVVDAVIAGFSRIPVITENVSAPTTSTVGNLGDVIFDTNGDKWELIRIVNNTYYWSPEGFPTLNNEFVSHYDSSISKIIYKCKITGTSPSAINTIALYPTNILTASKCIKIDGYLAYSALTSIPIIAHGTNAFVYSAWGAIISGVLNFVMYINTDGGHLSKPITAELYYIKG